MQMSPHDFEKAQKIFHDHHGILHASQASSNGISGGTLMQMCKSGLLERESLGIYRLANTQLAHPDWVVIAMRSPREIICLVSALAFHGLTTQIPHSVHIALPLGIKPPSLSYPEIGVFHLSGSSYSSGAEEHVFDGVPVRVYSKEKTVADCFKFRNKIGENLAVEALRDYCGSRRNVMLDRLMEYARINRVEKIMTPYLRALLL